MVKNTKVLVTGAAGFVGSHLSKRLEKEGYKLLLIDDFSRGKQKYLDYLNVKEKVLNIDLRHNNFDDVFHGVDTVYHTAGKIGGNQYLHGSPLNELTALQDNMAIDRNVFKACINNKVRKIIYTSSISVYNTAKQNTFTDAMFREDDIWREAIDPEGGYGWAKYIGELQLKMLSQNGTKVGVTRIFKSYGPCDDYSEESGQVVCSLMRKAINYPKEKYVLWGDGTVTRCLVYIDDLIDGIMELSHYIDKESLVVNLGGNEPYTMRHLATQIKKISNKNIDIENDMGKPVGVKSRIPVLELAEEKLNWKPTTSLEEGLKKTYQWMKEDMK